MQSPAKTQFSNSARNRQQISGTLDHRGIDHLTIQLERASLLLRSLEDALSPTQLQRIGPHDLMHDADLDGVNAQHAGEAHSLRCSHERRKPLFIV